MKMTVESGRLILKVLTPSYAPQVLEFYDRNRDRFEPWEPARVPNFYTEAFQSANLTGEYNGIIKSSFLRYFIFLKNYPQTIAGTVCFSNILRGAYQSCMIGYKMDRLFCLKGYGEEACRCGISIMFDQYELHRIEALVHPANSASLRLIEKLGFYQEGLSPSCIQINGRWEDHFRYSLIRTDWEAGLTMA